MKPMQFNDRLQFKSQRGNCKNCPTVLIVDDNAYNIYALNILINRLGFKADSASNGRTAVDMVLAKEINDTCSCQFKVILIDLNMPFMDGYESTELLQIHMQ